MNGHQLVPDTPLSPPLGHYQANVTLGRLTIRPTASIIAEGENQYLALSDAFGRFLESESARSREWLRIILDLTGVEMLNSYGISFVVVIFRTLRIHQCRLELLTSNPNMARIATFTHMDRFASIVNDAACSHPDEIEPGSDAAWHPIPRPAARTGTVIAQFLSNRPQSSGRTHSA